MSSVTVTYLRLSAGEIGEVADYIGGTMPFRPTATRLAESEPSEAFSAVTMTAAPDTRFDCVAFANVTIGVPVGTDIFFCSPLKLKVSS